MRGLHGLAQRVHEPMLVVVILRRTHTPLRSLVGHTALALTGVLVGALVVEGALRIATGPDFQTRPMKAFPWMALDPVLGWKNVPGRWPGGKDGAVVEINTLGFRGPEVTTVKREGVVRIVCLGGSPRRAGLARAPVNGRAGGIRPEPRCFATSCPPGGITRRCGCARNASDGPPARHGSCVLDPRVRAESVHGSTPRQSRHAEAGRSVFGVSPWPG